MKKIIASNYTKDQRQFLFGTISWLNQINGFVYEFWDGDTLTLQHLTLTDEIIRDSFFSPMQFKTNSNWHEEIALKLQQKNQQNQKEFQFITQEILFKNQEFLALNQGKAIGRLKIIESIENLNNINENDILLIKEIPLNLPPVAGLITERPSTVLSHVNLLAKSWGIPNLYLQNASEKLKDLDGKYIQLSIDQIDYKINEIQNLNNMDNQKNPKNINKINNIHTNNFNKIKLPNASVKSLPLLNQLRKADREYCGAKAANLGEIKSIHLTDVEIPDGFCIPYSYYVQFMNDFDIHQKIKQLESREDFKNNPSIFKSELNALRLEIEKHQMSSIDENIFFQPIIEKWQKQLQGKGVFVRSSSNSEDLPHLSGAGLYTTIPNVRQPENLIKAIKKVWASIFNDEAYKSRQIHQIPLQNVAMAILIQIAVPSENAGVLITRDPFDLNRQHITYIAAKRGLGIKVVEGQHIAEQIMYSSWSHAIQILSRSAENTQLVLNEEGGIQENQLISQPVVLTDDLIRRLAKMGLAIKNHFNRQDQDIEWASKDNQIILLQTRPFVTANASKK